MERHAAEQLHVEVPHRQRPLAGLADHGERLGQHVVQRRAARNALLELGGLGAQRLVGQGRDRRLERVDLPDLVPVLLEQPLVAAAEDAGEDVGDHESRSSGRGPKKQGVRTASPLISRPLAGGAGPCAPFSSTSAGNARDSAARRSAGPRSAGAGRSSGRSTRPVAMRWPRTTRSPSFTKSSDACA